MSETKGQVTTSQPSVQPPRIRRGRWILALIIAALIVLMVFHLFSRKTPTRGTPAQTVKVGKAENGEMPVTLNELGTVTPLATVTVLPQLSGYLTEVAFQEGQEVKKGQFLAQVDPRQYQVDLDEAQATLLKDQATLAQASSDLARYHQLRAQKAIAEQTVVDEEFTVHQDEAQVKVDQANIEQDKLDLVYCHITSPVDGRVGLRLVDAGNYVTASSSTGIAVVTTVKPTTVEFNVAQDDLANVIQRFHAGAKLPVTAYSSDNTRAIATGTLYAIGNQMTTATGTVTLRATFSNDDEALFPNEFVNVRMLVSTLQPVVVIPTPGVLSGAQGNYVYLVDSATNTVSVRPIKTGPSDGPRTSVLSGLQAGDLVAADGTDRLSDGARIAIASDDSRSPNPPNSGGPGAPAQRRPGQHQRKKQENSDTPAKSPSSD
jgi:multidrug efflux system membrane fusion protein